MKRAGIGIFLLAASTLVFELGLTRIFAVLFYHHFAFLIISTALFGFGLSGLFLFFRPNHGKHDVHKTLLLWTLAFALLIPITMKLILMLPYGFQEVFQQPFAVVRLIATYAVLAIPFFCAGCAISLILKSFADWAGRLYGLDLIGAALGCLAVLWLVPSLGGEGTVMFSAALAGAAALAFWPVSISLRAVCAVVAVALALALPYSSRILQLPLSRIFEEKRSRIVKRGNFFRPHYNIEFSDWSPISRIDVLTAARPRLIYLDGGSNVSTLVPFDGNLEALKPARSWRTIPYRIAPRQDVCIIGPGGGEDVLLSLSHRPRKITAVEMDPSILKLLRERYRDFTGRIIDAPNVDWINDEGRSYLRRSKKQFDLIQTVHNCAPVALASGALNLTETYLFTKEAFREYWQRLKPGGMLAINRSAILRAASVASDVLQSEGIQDPENYVMVTTRRGAGGDTGFYLKKGKVTETDMERLHEAVQRTRFRVIYAPAPGYQNEENIYYRLLKPDLRDAYIPKADVDLRPSTDNWPFFDHYQRFANFKQSTTVLPAELNASLRFWNLGDLALIALLCEAVVLSTVFIGIPLFRLRKEPFFSQGAVLAYFCALGAGFILVEISLFQKHILFLGQPVYSISAVLFSLLLFAGVGSQIVQSRFQIGQERPWLIRIGIALSVLLFLEAFVAPYLLDQLLGAGKVARFVISGLVIAPLGIAMGMPFPMGIKILGARNPQWIPWAWGLNAYMTVVGSVVSVILALTVGFAANFLIALALYTLGFAAFFRAVRAGN